MQCMKCGAPLETGGKYCPECGAEIPEKPEEADPTPPKTESPVYCPQCGAENGQDSQFCEKCGASLKEVEALIPVQPAGMNPTPPAAGKGKARKLIAVFLAAAVVVTASIAVFWIVDSRNDVPVLYGKDNGLNYIPAKKDAKSTQILGDLEKESRYKVQLAKDRRRVFYPKDNGDGSFSLYYKDLNGKEDDGEKVDSDVSDYRLLQDGSLLLYKKSDGGFYLNDLKDKTKIDSDVGSYECSSDGKTIIYMTSSGSLYRRGLGMNDDKSKIAGSVQKYYAGGDCKTVFYISDNNLYSQTEGKDRNKIASDVSDIYSFNGGYGTVCYVKSVKKTVNLSDYVEDDMAEADQSITQPDQNDYTTTKTDDFGDVFQDTDWDSYNKAESDYEAKQKRDELRQSLASATVDLETYTLYSFNGTDSKVVSENIAQTLDAYCSKDLYAAVYTKYNKSEIQKCKLSELDSIETLQNNIQSSQQPSDEISLNINGRESTLKQDKATDFSINNESLYFIDSPAQDGSGTLMKLNLDAGEAGTPQKVCDDVFKILTYSKDDSDILYEKNASSSGYDLYLGDQKISSNVYGFYQDGKNFFLMTDFDSKDQSGTLARWSNGKKDKIAEDVADFVVLDDSRIAYLHDFSGQSGDLMLKSGSGEPEKLDDDVNFLIDSDFDHEVQANG